MFRIFRVIFGFFPSSRKGKECMPDLGIPFDWGRQDCATAPRQTEEFEFPEPGMDRASMLNFFQTEFNFSPREVAALMGAHNLGEARIFNSGYDGAWSEGRENRFDNEFYKHLINRKLEFRNEVCMYIFAKPSSSRLPLGQCPERSGGQRVSVQPDQ